MSVTAVARVLERAALDGSTCVPVDVVGAALRSTGVADPGAVVQDAVESGAAVAHGKLLGHPHWAAIEQRVADALRAVAAGGGLTVVDAPRDSDPGARESGARVFERADLLGLADAEQLAELPASTELLLVGDPAMPPAPGPGAVLSDVAESGVATVLEAPGRTEPGPLAELVRALRTGALPTVSPDQRDVVVTPADDVEQALRRVGQLVTDSIPRAFGFDAADLLVLTVRADGRTGAESVRAGLDAVGAGVVEVRASADAVGRTAEAIVLLVGAEAAGSLSRDLLVGAATEARRHLSVVHQAGPALAEAVARRPHRPRRTLLGRLLH
ncbi:MAG: hypothetical protein M3353_05220 [Actinomycetota bacterium]|nr:hypothetical protein [Actinomycetota bacterium]